MVGVVALAMLMERQSRSYADIVVMTHIATSHGSRDELGSMQ